MMTKGQALQGAARQFRSYADQHRAKETPEAAAKAVVNDEMAAMCEEAALNDGHSFQGRVGGWMLQCFNPEIAADKVERGDRFLEEVFELLQWMGYDPGRVATVRDYVWGRPVGEGAQEVGGVMVCLAALCNACGLDLGVAAETELERILKPEIMEKIRAKQAAKPKMSPAPQ